MLSKFIMLQSAASFCGIGSVFFYTAVDAVVGCSSEAMTMLPRTSLSKKPPVKVGTLGRYLLISIVLFVFFLWSLSLLRTNLASTSAIESEDVGVKITKRGTVPTHIALPKQNELSKSLEERNRLPPRNMDLYPSLRKDQVVIVLYVHNRPQYLKVVVESLSRVDGINQTLLIVSHDGYFEAMNKIVESIKFCRVKQIFAPYSPHLFPDSFPGVSPEDCREKEDASSKKCVGNPDQYENFRSPKIVSLKHHWWWMMNTVWDGLEETMGHSGHMLFIEEDHYIFPNAYKNLKLLIKLKPKKCPSCYAVNLAPSDVKSRGEGIPMLIAERMGNVGYSFNRTVWEKIHRRAKEFCLFDEYNWDITMWSQVYPSFGGPVYTLRGPRSSAWHFGKCGLHQGQGENTGCIIGDDNNKGLFNIEVSPLDKVAIINPQWEVQVYDHQPGYKAGFKGWGGWGDERDHRLCLDFASMYQ